MICNHYENYEMGKIEEPVFRKHIQRCSACRGTAERDRQLFRSISDLNQDIEAPLLWAKIENSLRAEKKKVERKRLPITGHSHVALLRVAAVILVVLGVTTVFYSTKDKNLNDKNLLNISALQKVEKIEREHMSAIAELERGARFKIADLELELMLLYRDRLETIDAHIAQCKEALEANPRNTHIRRYMLAALVDKKQTLMEILDLQS